MATPAVESLPDSVNDMNISDDTATDSSQTKPQQEQPPSPEATPEEPPIPPIPPFPLFSLPTELRLRIYSHALAPSGTLTLHSRPTTRFAVTPSPTLSLLRASRTMHNEAADLLYTENTITLTLDACDTSWPTISPTRLPQRVLERVEHMCVVLDATAPGFYATFADVDFSAFEHLGALKTLRVAVVFRHPNPDMGVIIPTTREYNVVAQVLERIPASTKVVYGTEEGTQEHESVAKLFAMKARGAEADHVQIARREDLEACATSVPDLVRGCRSGGIRDGTVYDLEGEEGKGKWFNSYEGVARKINETDASMFLERGMNALVYD